jgi:hypothetical protein
MELYLCKISVRTGLRGWVQCHGEFATHWITTFTVAYDRHQLKDLSTLVNRKCWMIALPFGVWCAVLS